MRIKRVALEYHCHTALTGSHLIRSDAVDVELALADVLKSRDHSERRGLSAARRTYENYEFALFDLKVEVMHGVEAVRVDLVDPS